MKKLAVTIIIIFIQVILFGQCPPGDLMFTSQSQINDFGASYPNCHEFDGSIIISGSGITNLNGLSGLTSIAGDLSFLYVSGLTNMLGLQNLSYIGGSLTILEAYTLNNLMGLNSLATIGGELGIYNNVTLKRVNALDSLTFVNSIAINNNATLNSIPGMNKLETVGGNFVISDNPLMEDISGLYSLTEVGGGFYFQDSEAITSLSGLDNLSAVGGNLEIRFNSQLNDLSALQNLLFVGGGLNIRSNYALESLSGLDNIEPAPIGDLTIYNNPVLSTCEVLSICQYLASPGGEITITNNATGCDSQQEIEQACEWVSVEEPNIVKDLAVYPNPASSTVILEWTTAQDIAFEVRLLNISGQEVIRQSVSGSHTAIDISFLEAGIYILKIQSTKGVDTKKLLIN